MMGDIDKLSCNEDLAGRGIFGIWDYHAGVRVIEINSRKSDLL